MLKAATFDMAMPMFMENPAWYTKEYDSDGDIVYKLTENAPEEARKSFEEYQAPLTYTDDEGNNMIPEGWSAY